MLEQSRRDRSVAIWLLICCALVFAMVVLGGVTRLTGSGLSMVDWRPITGILPPLTAEGWQRTFEMYQQSPQFRHVNFAMDVHDFKGIFWLEYLHRVLGRIIGIVFLIPFLYFMIRGFIERREWPKFALMFVLGGLQGVLGWYMVKSGLVDRPEVSQYRLTAHLAAAFLIFAFMLWVALSRLYPAEGSTRHPWFGKAIALWVFISITILSGGFVAGLKAGHIYNTFPLMGDALFPPAAFALQPVVRNFFDNPVLVQFDHRLLAITTLLLVIASFAALRRQTTTQRTSRYAVALLVTVIAQASLGIATLLMHVPIVLATLHQATAMLVFTAALMLCHSLRANSA